MIPTGICTIYTLENVAPVGRKPEEKLVKLTTAYYAERTVGYNRYYAAAGANRRINMLIRLFNTSMVEEGMYVILEDGKPYQIDVMQKIIERDAVDLTLVRVEDYYDVATE